MTTALHHVRDSVRHFEPLLSSPSDTVRDVILSMIDGGSELPPDGDPSKKGMRGYIIIGSAR